MRIRLLSLLFVGFLLSGCLCSNHRKGPEINHRNTVSNPRSSQNTLSVSWTKEELLNATTTEGIDYMSDDERNVVLLCNLVRIYPRRFASIYLSSSKYRNSKNPFVISLLKDLEKASPQGLLFPNPILAQTAEYHALDMGKYGTVGHDSSNGTSCIERISAVYPHFAGECCQYGFKEPIQIVIDLLIDNGVASLGHRKMILESDAKEIGVAIRPHKTYTSNCVLDFGYGGFDNNDRLVF